MVLEIERKFILRNLSVLESLNSDGVGVLQNDIIQIYTKITPINEIRFRKINDKFFTTQKYGKGLIREEIESETSKEIFEEAQKNSVGMPIKKSRFSFKINNLPCNIDVFSEMLEGLITLEIEFLNAEDAAKFAIPDFIQNSIKTEITNDERYKNKNLALFGLPQNDFDIERTFKILQKNPNLKLAVPSGLRSIDALRVVLFQIYKTLSLNLTEFELKNQSETLHQIRINLRTTRSLLELFSCVFDTKVSQYFMSNFKSLANLTNLKRDIDVFCEFLSTQKHSSELIQILKKLEKNENQAIQKRLNSFEINELLKDWEVFLKEQSDFYKGQNFDEIIKKIVAKVMRLQILKIKKHLIYLDKQSINEKFHETRKHIKKLRYLVEIFIDLFSIKQLEKCSKRAKNMQDLFGNLQDTDLWLGLLARMQVHDKNHNIKEKIEKIAQKNRAEILSKKAKFAKTLGKVSRSLKIYYI